MIELTEDNLDELIENEAHVLVQYGAAWCGNCRLVKPKFKRLSNEHQDITFVYVDAEKLPASRSLAEVKNLPTFAGFVGGKLVKQSTGSKVEVINEIIDEITVN